jgi:hypothetical protein
MYYWNPVQQGYLNCCLNKMCLKPRKFFWYNLFANFMDKIMLQWVLEYTEVEGSVNRTYCGLYLWKKPRIYLKQKLYNSLIMYNLPCFHVEIFFYVNIPFFYGKQKYICEVALQSFWHGRIKLKQIGVGIGTTSKIWTPQHNEFLRNNQYPYPAKPHVCRTWIGSR